MKEPSPHEVLTQIIRAEKLKGTDQVRIHAEVISEIVDYVDCIYKRLTKLEERCNSTESQEHASAEPSKSVKDSETKKTLS